MVKIDDKSAFLVDSSILQHMFEGKNKGKTGELLKKMKEMKDSGMKIKVFTPMSSFLRAIFLADPKVTINNIQKSLSFLEILPTIGDFKSKKAVMEEMIEIAELMSKEKK